MCHRSKKQNPFAARSEHPNRKAIIQSRQQFLYCVSQARKKFAAIAEKCAPVRHDHNIRGCPDENAKRRAELLAKLHTVANLLTNNYASNYVAWSTESAGKVAFSPDGIHRHNDNRRRKTTLARYIGRQLSSEVVLTDQSLDLFCRAILRFVLISGAEFKVVHGDEVREAYANDFADSSCMSGCDSSYTQLYADNPDSVGMLKYTSEDSFNARALVWNCDDGTTFVDRIYPEEGSHVDTISEWAERKGYTIRNHHGAPSCDCGAHGLTVTLKSSSNGEWPYMDTFRYTDDSSCDRELTFSPSRGDNLLDSTCGEFADENMESCVMCGDHTDEENCHYIESRDGSVCSHCLSNYFIYCECVSECVPDSEVVCAEDTGEAAPDYYASDNWYSCDDCNEWFEECDSIRIPESGDSCYCESCYSDKYTMCDDCSDELHVDDASEANCCESCQQDRDDEANSKPDEIVSAAVAHFRKRTAKLVSHSDNPADQLALEERDHRENYALPVHITPTSCTGQLSLFASERQANFLTGSQHPLAPALSRLLGVA